jgi:hypothetical protein
MADRAVTEEIVNIIFSEPEIMKELLENPAYLIPLLFVIVEKGKQRRTLPFFLNSVQVHLLKILQIAINDFKKGKPTEILNELDYIVSILKTFDKQNLMLEKWRGEIVHWK